MASVMQAQVTANPIAGVLQGFGVRRIACDGIFFKVNLPETGLALLVDISTTRRHRRRVIQQRATLFTPDGVVVETEHFPLSALKHDQNDFTIAKTWVGANGSRGTIGTLSWDLVFGASGPLVDPQVTGDLHPFDLRLRTVPDVQMSGNLRVQSRGYSFSHEPGMIGAAFGRRVPDAWTWISANGFDLPGVSMECLVIRSRIFGLPFLRARVGYFHLRTPSSVLTLLHPLTGQIRVMGSRHAFSVAVRQRQGPPIIAHCAAPDTRFYHVGNRTHLTLLGTCAIEGLGVADGVAAMSARDPRRGRRA
jgi:hypothetical protein